MFCSSTVCSRLYYFDNGNGVIKYHKMESFPLSIIAQKMAKTLAIFVFTTKASKEGETGNYSHIDKAIRASVILAGSQPQSILNRIMLYDSYFPSQQVEMVFTNLHNRYPGLKDSSEATKHDANVSPTQQTDTRRVGSGCSRPHDVVLEAALTAIPVHVQLQPIPLPPRGSFRVPSSGIRPRNCCDAAQFSPFFAQFLKSL